MIVFIDDSGDPGFKFKEGSSEHFVIAAIIFEDNLEAEKTAVAIKELRRELGFGEHVEFKFNKSRKEIKLKFLETINEFSFKVRCLVIEKESIISQELRNNKNSFYAYTVKMLLKHSPSLIDAKIRIDGGGNRNFRKNFITYLRKELNSKQKNVMKNCKFINSKSNVLIQMADMIAGSVKRSYSISKTDNIIYKNIFKKHIEDEWNFK